MWDWQVCYFQTEYEGQAKKYMEVLEDVDAVVVAGGDGTLLEVLYILLDIFKIATVFVKITTVKP